MKKPHDNIISRRYRFIISFIIFIISFYFTAFFTNSDFLQDYSAAWAWWHHLSTNSPTNEIMAQCCTNEWLDPHIIQTAHPPIITTLILPLALLPYKPASILWLAINWSFLLAGWELLALPISHCIAVALFAVVGLSVGNLEPIIFFCIAFMLSRHHTHPIITGMVIGLACAIKIYPLLFIVGLWLLKEQKSAIIAIISAGAISLFAEVVLGFGTTIEWLSYAQYNTIEQISSLQNISLTHTISMVFPSASSTFLFLSLTIVLFTLYIYRILPSGDLSSITTILLLVSPISWPHYMIIRPNISSMPEKIILFAVSLLFIMTRWLPMIPNTELMLLIYPMMTACLVYAYAHALLSGKARSGLKSSSI